MFTARFWAMHDVGQKDYWWGDFTIAHGEGAQWRLGSATLWVQRLSGEWRFGWTWQQEEFDPLVQVTVPSVVPDLLMEENVVRFAVSHQGEELVMQPAMADRAVITRPEKPFAVMPGDSTKIFVGSSLWVRLSDSKTGEMLTEVPIWRPSDTWFGPTTAGELCYSAKTFCRLHIEQMPHRPHRALSVVHVVNRSKLPLPLDRFRLPSPNLALHVSSTGQLWTDDLVVEQHEDHTTSVKVQPTPHESKLLTPAREPIDDNAVVRVFSSIFGKGVG